MATKAKVKLKSGGMRALLLSDGCRRDLTRRAQRVLSAAQSAAPVATGDYKGSLKLEQATTDRAVVRVVATAAHSHVVERNHGVLARALDAAGGA